MSLLHSVRTWGRMVRFSHSIFALPFAFSGAALAAAEGGITPAQLLWIAVAMVGARNAAMGFGQRRGPDAFRPGAAGPARVLPSGRLDRGPVWLFTLLLAALFVFASFRLNALCGWLSPVALLLIFGYSYSKRFTWASHLLLGLALAIAPVGGWVAIRGSFSALSWLLGGAVLLWVAGFDVIYACQDVGFDRAAGLSSIPARFGRRRALFIARALHASALLALAGVGLLAGLHPVYWAGWAVICGLVVWQHRMVRPDDLSRVGVAFFNMNGTISVVYLVAVLLAVLLTHGHSG